MKHMIVILVATYNRRFAFRNYFRTEFIQEFCDPMFFVDCGFYFTDEKIQDLSIQSLGHKYFVVINTNVYDLMRQAVADEC